MKLYYLYKTPEGLDDLLLASNGKALTDLRFASTAQNLNKIAFVQDTQDRAIFMAKEWLDLYFAGKNSNILPKCSYDGLTEFAREVMAQILLVPFGETTTYGAIAKEIAKKRGIAKMSARAVGGALNKNPICIIYPCHRVVGANGKLVGFGGGIENKKWLLEFERKHKND